MSTEDSHPLGEVDLLLTGATVVTMDPDRRVLLSGHVAIADGRFVAVGTGDGASIVASEVRDVTGSVLLPGFVNTHDHLVSVLTRGLGGDRFLSGGDPKGKVIAGAIRSSLDEARCYSGARLAISELLLSGVTTTADSQAARRGFEHGADGTLRALSESGMRGVYFRASVDRTEIVPSSQHDDEALALSELDRLQNAWDSDRVTVGAEAMAMHRVSPNLLRRLHEWTAANDAPFAMHISYSEESAQYAIDEHGARLIEVLDRWEVLDDRFLGYHPVWLDDAEIAAVERTGAGLALCPAANMLIGMKAAPLEKLLAAGARLGLGVDQPNDGHNFFETMKTTILQQRAAEQGTGIGSPEMALEMATIGGAMALHREHEIGSIEVGKFADIVLTLPDGPASSPLTGRISNLVYASSPQDIASVLIGGRDVVSGGRLLPWDIEAVVADVGEKVGDVLARDGLSSQPLTKWPVLDS
jgi:5-methylthioadenosine/S-adenosylhomocysteine deaminase